MAHRTPAALVAALLLLAPARGHTAVSAYTQNFEGLLQTNPNALAADGWLVFGNVFDPTGTTWLYGYGPFPAPNTGAAFCAIATGQGGADQGTQQLSVYSDYNNQTPQGHAGGYRIESNVFREQTISIADVGTRWVFLFDAKLGNLTGSTTALAFIKTLDPNSGYALTNFKQRDMTTIPATWSRYWLAITIDAGLVGQILQFGFLNNASNNEGSGVFYDNLSWEENYTTDVAGMARVGGPELLATAPNPFVRSTRIAYSISLRGPMDLSIYDVLGRRIAVLFRGEGEPGSHVATWDGRSSDGRLAPAGVYRCVLQTAEGSKARRMVLTP